MWFHEVSGFASSFSYGAIDFTPSRCLSCWKAANEKSKKKMTVSSLEGKEKSRKLRRRLTARYISSDKQLTEGGTPNKVIPSPLDSGTLPKCWIVTCAQSLKKLLAIVLKLETSGLRSSMGWTDWISIKNWLFDVVRTNEHRFHRTILKQNGSLGHQNFVIESAKLYMRDILCHSRDEFSKGPSHRTRLCELCAV